jgi:glycerol-3-phosphate dehydrogenase
VHAVTAEMAVRPMDVLARRLRLAFLDHAAASAALPRVVALMADAAGWSAPRRQREESEARAALSRGVSAPT